jgi:pSer/pThr/pTyr-binding forkhead associated (FHA) protein
MANIVQIHEGVAIKKFPLKSESLRIGRDPQSGIFIDDKVVSQSHALVEAVETSSDEGRSIAYFIEDLGSTNGTFVNDKKITRRKLDNEDIIRIGWNIFKFVDEAQQKSEKTVKIHKSWIPGVYYTKE